jgi:hypothetical protein
MEALVVRNHYRRRAIRRQQVRLLLCAMRLSLLALSMTVQYAEASLGKEKGDYNPALRITRNHYSGTTNLASMAYSCEECYRLSEVDMITLADALLPCIPTPAMPYPDMITPIGRYKFNNVEGLCIVSRRLSFPFKWSDMETHFGRSASALCTIFYHVAGLILAAHGHLLDFVPGRFVNSLARFARAIASKGVPAAMNVCGFMDGTKRQVCYPWPAPAAVPPGLTRYLLQRALYTGKNKIHCISFQIISFPNGIICMYGPLPGRHADPMLL